MITPLEFALYAVIGVLVSIIIMQYVGKQEIIEQMDKEIKYWHEMYEQKNDEDKLLFKDGVLVDSNGTHHDVNPDYNIKMKEEDF